MFFAALTLFSAAVAVNGAGLKAASTSPYGQSTSNFALHQINPSAYVLDAGHAVDLTISAVVEGGLLKMVCPTAGLEAVLVPVAQSNPANYTVEFVSSHDGLPEGAVFGGWSLSDDRIGLSNANFTKVVNTIGDGEGKFANEHTALYGDDVFAFTWVDEPYSQGGAYYLGSYLVLDTANDVAC
ncbi:uncharacterized protein SCHCODRAFT_02624663 [Schizophyllum commune H4-8]|uniref:uncharacterized protein n=1 Tax=Schizophyllum commune (strain H4-8 / FGSC 9210) TaxID=578458 RepID=UPI00215F841E|nr:uncharacterized protein SCHCODRAFT_02624663 [Schizophyllum commune H4-8]KAI5894435.1 hypothetical protein SCHCODRAFT_02624663 [Schizophyllum commune H4-8]